jgi:hypothetical protein
MRRLNGVLPQSILIWAVLCVVGFSLQPAVAVHLLQGESVILNITGLMEERPRLANNTCQEVGEATVRFRGDLLMTNELIRIELFETSVAEAPFVTLERSGLGAAGTGGLGPYFSSHWQDLQGVMRITMLSGSVNVDSVYVSIQNDGCGRATNTIDSPTPPTIDCPTTAALDCTNSAPLLVTVEDLSGEALTVWWLVNGVAKQTNVIPAVNFAITSAEVAFSPALGLGQYEVTVLVSNSVSGAACSTILTVADRTPPILFCPPNSVLEFVNELGAAAEFATGATDCDTNVTVVSVPPSGSVFPIGTNLVRSTATDSATNVGICQFTITVLGARGVLSNVVAELTALRELETEPKQQRRLDDALVQLSEALESGLFVNETHLARPSGGRVFRQHRRAINDLRRWMRRENDPALRELAQNFIDRLVRSDRLLAAIAIQEAIEANGIQTRILAAQIGLAKGDLAELRERYEQATADYRSAWLRAGRAVR